MQPKEQYELYKLFCDLMFYYTKTLSLSMADNELHRRYHSSVASLKRYLVQTFATQGINDVLAHKSVDFSTGKFIGIPDPSYWYINPQRHPKLAEHIQEMEKLYNAKRNCRKDYNKVLENSSYYFKNILSKLNKYNYIPTPLMKKKIDIVSSIADLLNGKGEFKNGLVKSIASNYTFDKNGKRIDTDYYIKPEETELGKRLAARWGLGNNTDNKQYAADGSPYVEVALEIENRRYYIYDVVVDIFKYLYIYFKQRNDEFTFYQIFETAHVDTRYAKGNTIEKSLEEGYKLFDLPENPISHIRLEYTTLESIQPKTKPVSQTSKVTTSKVKKEPVKKAVKPKVEPVKEEVKVEVVKPKVEVVKPVVEPKIEPLMDECNVLEISKYCETDFGYRIEKVFNKAKKIIIGDEVRELSMSAFNDCKSLEEISIGKNLRTIKFGQFKNCLNLKKVTFSEGLYEIQNCAFENTNLMGEITLPSSLSTIGRRAFNVKNPKELIVNVSEDTTYDESAFHELITLNSEIVKEEVEVVSKKKEYTDICSSSFAFETEISFYSAMAVDIYKAHEVLVIPTSITKVGFRKETKNNVDTSKVKKIVIGKHVKFLANDTFVMFNNLEELEFAEDCSIFDLPNHMIGNCKITHITIPDGVESIFSGCFELCKSLKSISVSKHLYTRFLKLPAGCEIIVRK